MRGPIHDILTGDHARLEALLSRATSDPARLDHDAFEEFRAGLLRHIAIEEKILLPDARRRRGGTPLPLAERLRIDHGALASLLVPTADAALVDEIREILGTHDTLEEQPGGLYDQCDELAGADVTVLVKRIRMAPAVRVAKHFDGHGVHRTAASALAASARSHARDHGTAADGAEDGHARR
jgi:hypothetical protein